MGEQRNEAIANMEAMGFERSQIDAAMRAAFYNPERAVEYLLGVCSNSKRTRFSFSMCPVANGVSRESPSISNNPRVALAKLPRLLPLPPPRPRPPVLPLAAMMMEM
jgi:hypothetical protein